MLIVTCWKLLGGLVMTDAEKLEKISNIHKACNEKLQSMIDFCQSRPHIYDKEDLRRKLAFIKDEYFCEMENILISDK